LKDIRQDILKFRKDTLIFTIVASHTGIKDLGKMRACIDLVIEPGLMSPFSRLGEVVPSEGLVRWAIEVNIISGKFAVSAQRKQR
jgi:hypothetical protein